MSEFVWRVSRTGYYWHPWPPSEGEVSVLAVTPRKGYFEARPMQNPALYREFADLHGPDAYLAFAGKYGSLTRRVISTDPDARPGDGGGSTSPSWLASPPGSPDVPGTVVQVEAGPFPVVFMNPPESATEWSLHTAWMRKAIGGMKNAWRPTHPMPLGATALGKLILAELRPRVTPDFDAAGALTLVPLDLLGALWLQLARAVAAPEPRQCRHCGVWFEVSVQNPGTSRSTRSDKVFCSVRCRMAAAYRKRKSEGAAKGAAKRSTTNRPT